MSASSHRGCGGGRGGGGCDRRRLLGQPGARRADRLLGERDLVGGRVGREEALVVVDRLPEVPEVELDLAEREQQLGPRLQPVRREQLVAGAQEVALVVELAAARDAIVDRIGAGGGRRREAGDHERGRDAPRRAGVRAGHLRALPSEPSVGSSSVGFHSTLVGGGAGCAGTGPGAAAGAASVASPGPGLAVGGGGRGGRARRAAPGSASLGRGRMLDARGRTGGGRRPRRRRGSIGERRRGRAIGVLGRRRCRGRGHSGGRRRRRAGGGGGGRAGRRGSRSARHHEGRGRTADCDRGDPREPGPPAAGRGGAPGDSIGRGSAGLGGFRGIVGRRAERERAGGVTGVVTALRAAAGEVVAEPGLDRLVGAGRGDQLDQRVLAGRRGLDLGPGRGLDSSASVAAATAIQGAWRGPTIASTARAIPRAPSTSPAVAA